jgi:hypothetical protein
VSDDALHESVDGLYLPPVFVKRVLSSPPQTIISDPVHTVVWCRRALGKFAPEPVSVEAAHEFVAGSYRPPLLKYPFLPWPPQTIISAPVQTAVW